MPGEISYRISRDSDHILVWVDKPLCMVVGQIHDGMFKPNDFCEEDRHTVLLKLLGLWRKEDR